ncbi:MAG: ABC transporter ATP-binding protein [Lachnospiraceae bacterium]|nr:ABC transporter ATP-binding protein [Lachnospiraceae bacterium]
MLQIQCRDLTLGYEKQVVAWDISFEVHTGDYLCILGENGSGKSTLVKTLLGLQKPMSGTLKFGQEIRADEIGYLPQQTDTQRDFPASVEEIVLSGCVNRLGIRPFYGRLEKEIARENMEQMGIGNLAKRCYRELSGGQQQRVLLARALCATRKLLLLDEPVAGLDPKAAEEMYGLIERLNREQGISVIMVSHDVLEAVPFASHILYMSHRDVFFGDRESYLTSPAGQMYASLLKAREKRNL